MGFGLLIFSVYLLKCNVEGGIGRRGLLETLALEDQDGVTFASALDKPLLTFGM